MFSQPVSVILVTNDTIVVNFCLELIVAFRFKTLTQYFPVHPIVTQLTRYLTIGRTNCGRFRCWTTNQNLGLQNSSVEFKKLFHPR